MPPRGGGPTVLVGREPELDLLERVAGSIAAGHAQVVIVEGEPGMGKTRLVDHGAEIARNAGFEVRVARCDEAERARPFAAIVRALASGERTGTTAETAPTVPGVQHRIIEELGDAVERLAVRQPVWIAVDDLQWADPSTLAALRSIARRCETLPVALVLSCREGHDVAEAHRFVDDMIREGASHLALGPLNDVAVEALVAELAGATAAPSLLDRLRGAAGNPLFVTEYVRALTDAGDEAGSGAATMPEDFRRMVRRRIGTLPEPTRRLVRLASVFGAPFSPSDLAAVLGRPLLDIEPVLEQSIAAGIIGEQGAHLVFRHSLVRDAIYEHMPLAVRRDLHREVARALQRSGVSAVVVAHHMARSASPGDAEAVACLRDAARDAQARSPSVAVDLLEQALALASGSYREREGLLADLVLALAWAGRLAEVESLAAEVLDRDPDPEVAGAVRCGLVYSLTWQGRPREALRHAQLLAPDAVAGRYAALLQAEAAVATLFSFDLAGAGRLGGEAARAAEAGGDDVALCHALAASSWATLFGGRSDEALRVVRRLMTVADRSEDPGTTLAHPRFFPGMPLMYLDRLDEAERVLQSGRRQAQEMGLVWSLPLYHAHLGTRRFISGEWDDAVAELEGALVLGDEVGLHLPITAAASSWLTAIHLHRGEIEAADAVVTKALRRVTETGLQLGMGLLNWARALVLDSRGETEEAIGLLQTAWDLYAAGGPVTDPWTAMALVRMRTRADQHDQARALLATIDEQAMVSGTPFMQGQALRCRGLVEEDADVLLAAVVEYRHCPRPFEVASACDDAGLLLVRSGRIAEAVPLFEEAMAIYDRLGASRESARVRAELRSHGVAHGVRAARARAVWGWESLTPTELKVVDLVVQRLSNPEVAERLFISRHTVESHLKHIYRKLAITSRVALTRLVTNRSADGDP